MRRAAVAMTALLALSTLVACSSGKKSATASGRRELIGLFRLTAGAVNGNAITGTWFRMLQPGGNAKSGPYMVNADSPADGGQATLLAPGSSGGLRTGGYQSQPAPAFDAGGNSLAGAITTPTKFFGVKFSISTNEVDLQTKTKVAPPTILDNNGHLSGDLAAWAASWNNQNFNQGAPKPVSSTQAQAPGQQQAQRVWDWVSQKWLEAAPKSTVSGGGATGTYDAKTGAFTLEWTSHIDGGPFNGFTGLWHLEGTFESSGRAPAGA
ncbi:MAG: hypothetical protein JO087_09535 [Actinobacteria bacterium]|nr:hypothetical protein [Actinomycetota bacterium]